MRRVSATILLILFATSVPGFAQNITGSMSGRVVDQQGSAVPNATVTATDTARKSNSVTKTGAEGDFSIAGLQPSTYNVTVEASGFKRLTRQAIALNAADKLALGDLGLEVGAVTESIEVSAEAALLQTESVERSQAIVAKQIENIEVNGRNPLDMAKLIPGVVSTANFQVGGVGGLSGLQVNGNRGTENNLTINGIGDIDTGANGSQNVTVSIDSMAEFKVLTGIYQAEYGRNAGAQIQLVTKSGTDQFHGSGYIYHRNEGLNANTFLNNYRGLPRGLYRYNDPGFTIGGPLYIPKVLPWTKNKLYFFYSEEWQLQLAPNGANNRTVPTAAERKGDFSQTVDNNGKLLAQLNDPLGGTFPNKMIPASRFYGPGVALANFLPLPNTSGIGYNYTSQISGHQPRREDLVRIDYNARSNIRVFGHFIQNANPVVSPYGSFVLGENIPLTNINVPNPGFSFAGGATFIIGPTMTNEFNMGMTKNQIDIYDPNAILTRTHSGVNLPLLYPSAVQDDYLPQINVGGSHLANSPSFGTADAPFHNYNTTIDWSDNLTKVWGTHTIKAGVYLQRSRKNQTSFSDNNGSYNWGDNSANPLDTGYGYANMLLGVYNSFDQSSAYINGLYRYWNIEEFVQDTWKVTPRLTFDYGLRGQWYQPQYDAGLQASTFVLANWDPKKAPRLYSPAKINGVNVAFDPVTGQQLPAYDVGLEVPGSGDPFNGICQAGGCINKYLQKNRGQQWAPRFGAAWDVTGKANFVIRAGGGIYYDRFQGNRVFDFVRNPPESVQPTLQYGYAQNITPGNALLAPPTLYAADPTGKIPTTYQYQFDIQTRLPWDMSLDTAYVGTLSRHLQDNRNLNYVPYGTAFQSSALDPTQATPSVPGNGILKDVFLRPIYGYNNINLYESAATANYNALQVQLQRRASHGLFFGVAYTWSKAMTTASSDTSFVRADQFEKIANYGPASFDRTHVLAINFVYNLPKTNFGNYFTKLVTDGWQLSSVIQASTGAPFTPGYSISGINNQNITGSTTEGARIGYVKGCNPYTGSDNPFNRLNISCFTAPQPGSLGLESGVNWLRNPGLVQFDLSAQKEFAIKERLRIQLRADAFNVFNHPNFTGLNTTVNFSGTYPGNLTYANPNITASNGTQNLSGFGVVNGTAPARIMQLVARIQF